MKFYLCIDDYVEPRNKEDWKECPKCSLKPKVWLFNNGCSTACGCGENKYDHFSVRIESILSVYKRTGKTAEYKGEDGLKEKWNHYCNTGEVIPLEKGKW